VRPSTPVFSERGFSRGSRAAKLSSAAVVVGLAVATVVTAAPVGASEPMRVDLHKLRLCESGDNYRADTGNGYYGAYQFVPSTWHSLGFKGRPDLARAAVQNRAARKEHSVAGWTAWPECSKKDHLR
jgi:hypothetical protein